MGIMKASKFLTLEQRNFQWGIYNNFKTKHLFPYNFEQFLSNQYKIHFI